MPFQIVRDDITKVHADAIVNTANPRVEVGKGVDSAIYEAAGKEKLLSARRKIGVLNPGEAGITPAFALKAKYIIHSCGIRYKDGKHGEAEILRRCYDKSLALAQEKHCKSIAFPLMAAGQYGFPEELGIQIAVDAFTDFLRNNEMNITLVVFGSNAYKISGGMFENVVSYVDDNYVREVEEKEFGAAIDPHIKFFANASTFMPYSEMQAKKISSGMKFPLDKRIKEIHKDSFSKHLQQMINKKGLKNSEVYVAANISKQYFSKLLKGNVKPSKEKVLALAVGLRLNMDEAIDFLKVAGYAFSPVSQTDVIVEYFLQNGDYSVIKINIVLFDYGLPGLSE